MRESQDAGLAGGRARAAARTRAGVSGPDAGAAASSGLAAPFRLPAATLSGWATPAAGPPVHVEVFGRSDGPTVVLAHGWTCSIPFWAPVVNALAGEARIVAYDLPGHGASPAPAHTGYTTDALADSLAAVVEAYVPDGERAVMVGHSMGAMSLVAFAGRHPAPLRARVSAAVLASTGVANLVLGLPVLPSLRWARGVNRRITVAAMASRLPLGRRSSPASRALIRALALSPGATAEQVRFCERIIRACPPAVRGRWGRVLARLDLRADVPALAVPTVVISGTADRMTPPRRSDVIAAALPDLTDLVRLPGAGHMTPVETTDAVVAAIRRQLAGSRLDGFSGSDGLAGSARSGRRQAAPEGASQD